MLKRLSHKGDTIVEVMVVLAILGLAVSISYATANTSILDTRQAYEASQAAVVVQSQVEALHVLSGNPPTDPNYIFGLGAGQPFCISNGNVVYPIPAPPHDPCIITTYSATNPYNVTIIGPGGGGNGGTFTVTATWQDIEGQGTDTDQIVYRLYPQYAN